MRDATRASEATLIAGPDRPGGGALIGGRFRVQAILGEGGAGTVYRVTDERDGRLLALKQLQLNAGIRGRLSAALFEREYHTLRQLAHPRIIEVFDYGVDIHGAFYTMELLDGSDLHSLGVQPWRRACALLCDVASSLAIIHSRRLVHRDVTARNVRCTGDGGAKLIDFGTMAPMGVARYLAGTPMYLAPESLELQALDGRADLYALGALAYFVLSGYHAYQAASPAGLRAAWRSLPLPPGHYQPLPPALDQLVMELLALDRDARPSSAAEVMERLSGIAGLPLTELPQVQRSYLVMPNLVGREAPLQQVRDAMVASLASGQGCSFLLEGEAGVGRSRMLDACVLEAQLLGALVLRADSSDSAEGGPLGAIRVLCQQLWEAEPELCEQAGQRRAEILAEVLPELAPDDDVHAEDASAPVRPSAAPKAPAARTKLLAALQEFLLAIARRKPLLIAVDDVEAIDEPSAALLSMLANVIRQRPLQLIATSKRETASGQALDILRGLATVIPLPPLDAEQTEVLLRSIFGDATHVSWLAGRLHGLSLGSPRSIMTLAEHLITSDLARYEAGSWSLPAELRTDQLPRSATAALLDRLERLPDDARDLIELLALTDAEALAPELYPQLCEHGDPARVYQALEDLITAGVLRRIGDRYRLAQPEFGEALGLRLDPERRRALHSRLSRVLVSEGATERAAYHLLLGGHELDGIERLRRLYQLMLPTTARELELLRCALGAAERLKLPLRDRLELRLAILHAAAYTGDRELFLAHAPGLAERFERDSGLWDYRELPADLPPEARSAEALRRVQLRQSTTHEADLGFSIAAIEQTAGLLYGATIMMASTGQELALLEGLPQLDALLPRSLRARMLTTVSEVWRSLQAGRTTLGLEKARRMLEVLDQARDQLSRPAVTAARNGLLFTTAQFAATGGHAAAGVLLSEFDQIPGHRANAWRVRMVYELMQGNMQRAADCQRRAELLNLQDGGQAQFPTATVRIELIAHMYADDVMGVKRAMERITALAARFPGWLPTRAVARCHYRRLQGDAAGGLSELQPALTVPPGRHLDWWLIAYSHIKVLCDMGRGEEAVACGERYLSEWTREQLSTVDYGLRQAMAEALASVGRLDDARSMIEIYIDTHERAGTRGLRLALAYETAAQIAIADGDEAAFNRYATLCARQYQGARNRLQRAREQPLYARTADVF